LQVVHLFGKGAAAVACGHTYTAAVLRDGSLYAWGTGLGGQLGLGDAAPPTQVLPARVPVGRLPGASVRIELLACGPYHLAAVSREGVLYTWGDGLFGKLGHGSHDSAAAPRVVEALRGSWVVGAACGWWHTAAVAVPREDIARRRTASLGGGGGGGASDSEDGGDGLAAQQQRPTSPPAWPPPAPSRPSSALSAGGWYGGRSSSIGGSLYTWGGDLTWQLHGKRDHHQGCLGHGDLEGRLLPTEVLGEDDVRQARGKGGEGPAWAQAAPPGHVACRALRDCALDRRPPTARPPDRMPGSPRLGGCLLLAMMHTTSHATPAGGVRAQRHGRTQRPRPGPSDGLHGGHQP
jgi:hypothetical protein